MTKDRQTDLERGMRRFQLIELGLEPSRLSGLVLGLCVNMRRKMRREARTCSVSARCEDSSSWSDASDCLLFMKSISICVFASLTRYATDTSLETSLRAYLELVGDLDESCLEPRLDCILLMAALLPKVRVDHSTIEISDCKLNQRDPNNRNTHTSKHAHTHTQIYTKRAS
jgi:hypothetical protein